MMWSAILFVLVGIYCLARAFFDLRAKRYLWAALGLVAAIICLLVPMPSQMVTVTMTPPQAAR